MLVWHDVIPTTLSQSVHSLMVFVLTMLTLWYGVGYAIYCSIPKQRLQDYVKSKQTEKKHTGPCEID